MFYWLYFFGLFLTRKIRLCSAHNLRITHRAWRACFLLRVQVSRERMAACSNQNDQTSLCRAFSAWQQQNKTRSFFLLSYSNCFHEAFIRNISHINNEILTALWRNVKKSNTHLAELYNYVMNYRIADTCRFYLKYYKGLMSYASYS